MYNEHFGSKLGAAKIHPLEAPRARGRRVLQPVEVDGIVPALIVNAGILMPRHVYVPVLVQPLPALHVMQL